MRLFHKTIARPIALRAMLIDIHAPHCHAYRPVLDRRPSRRRHVLGSSGQATSPRGDRVQAHRARPGADPPDAPNGWRVGLLSDSAAYRPASPERALVKRATDAVLGPSNSIDRQRPPDRRTSCSAVHCLSSCRPSRTWRRRPAAVGCEKRVGSLCQEGVSPTALTNGPGGLVLE